MATPTSLKTLKIVLFLLVTMTFLILANQISSPKRVWSNQKIGHLLRSSDKLGHVGADNINSNNHNNNKNFTRLSRHPTYYFDSYQQIQEAGKRPSDVIKSIGLLSSSSLSSPALLSSSSASIFKKMDGMNSSYDSSLYLQMDQPHLSKDMKPKNGSGPCYPCRCSSTKPTCKAGVNPIMDGCGCCEICARQMGDLCNHLDKCDEVKSLYCEFGLDNGFRGYCRARNPRACNISGKTIIDGQQYQPNCSMVCTCQDGKYACSSLCPQELRPPSSTYCKDAQLVTIKERCCKEWVCPNPHNYPVLEDTQSSQYLNEKACNKEVTEWSSCSVQCGWGESIRVTSDNDECQARQERRLCVIRPCGPMPEMSAEEQQPMRRIPHHPNKPDPSKKYPKNNLSVKTPERGVPKCRATVESPILEKIHYEECVSEQSYKLRYCSTCRKCCQPEKTRTIEVKFECPEGKTLIRQFMFIEKCVCRKGKLCP